MVNFQKTNLDLVRPPFAKKKPRKMWLLWFVGDLRVKRESDIRSRFKKIQTSAPTRGLLGGWTPFWKPK